MRLSEIKLTEDEKECRLSTLATSGGGNTRELYFLVDRENKDKLQTELADSFLVGLLIPAMKTGEDLYISNPVSKRLLWGIKNYIMPELHKMNHDLSEINIVAETKASDCVGSHISATGLSGGVDCIYTILKNRALTESNFKIGAVCLYNLYRLYCDEVEAQNFFALEKNRKLEFSDDLGIPILAIDTNLWEFYEGFRYIQVNTFYAMANILCFEGYINTYYYSSTYTLQEFGMIFDDTSHYDIFTQAFLRTEAFEMISDSNDIDRFNKTHFIADNSVALKHLDVCNNKILALKNHKKNCSKCDKCIRTMLTLDVLDKLESFSETFDLDDYYRNRDMYWIQYFYLSMRTNDYFMMNVIEKARKSNYKFPKHIKLKMLGYFIKLQIEKVKKG